jgi:hypothetical protein
MCENEDNEKDPPQCTCFDRGGSGVSGPVEIVRGVRAPESHFCVMENGQSHLHLAVYRLVGRGSKQEDSGDEAERANIDCFVWSTLCAARMKGMGLL